MLLRTLKCNFLFKFLKHLLYTLLETFQEDNSGRWYVPLKEKNANRLVLENSASEILNIFF